VPYLTESGADTAEELYEGGREHLEGYARALAERVDEGFARTTFDFVLNAMYSRGVLSSGIRELCAVAALTALGRHPELRGHIRSALRTNPAEHVREAILQMSVYAGYPAMLEGLDVFDEVLAEVSARS